MYDACKPRTNILTSVNDQKSHMSAYCWATPVRLPAVSHNRATLPTAPATAACHLRSPSAPSRWGGPKDGSLKMPNLYRFLKYANGGARRSRCSVSVLRNVNVPEISPVVGVNNKPIIRPNRYDSGPRIARRRARSFGRLLRIDRKMSNARLTPDRTLQARMSDPDIRLERHCHPRRPLFAASTKARS